VRVIAVLVGVGTGEGAAVAGVHTYGTANCRGRVVAAPCTEASSLGMNRRNWNKGTWTAYVGR